jgi:hypothetical protein
MDAARVVEAERYHRGMGERKTEIDGRRCAIGRLRGSWVERRRSGNVRLPDEGGPGEAGPVAASAKTEAVLERRELQRAIGRARYCRCDLRS